MMCIITPGATAKTAIVPRDRVVIFDKMNSNRKPGGIVDPFSLHPPFSWFFSPEKPDPVLPKVNLDRANIQRANYRG